MYSATAVAPVLTHSPRPPPRNITLQVPLQPTEIPRPAGSPFTSAHIFLSAQFLPQVILALLITLRAPRFLRVSFVVLHIIYTTQFVWRLRNSRETGYTTGQVMGDYHLASAATTQVLGSIVTLMMSLGTDTSGRSRTQVLDVVKHEDDVGQLESGKRPFLQRFYWAWSIVFSSRNIGTNVQVKNVPHTPAPRSRLRFIFASLLRTAKYYLIIDVCMWYLHNPLICMRGRGGTRILTANQPLQMRCVSVLILGSTGYALLQMQYNLIAAVVVGLRLSKPKSWPKPFGNWREAYTIRRFWGTTWHQILRKLIGPINSSLPLTHGTRLSSNIQLIVGFSISALIHFAGDLAGNVPLTPGLLKYPSTFFLVQPLGIMFEDLVTELFGGGKSKTSEKGQDAKPSRGKRMLGYTWMFAWFVLTLPIFMDGQMAAGIGKDRVIPVEWSVVQRFVGY
ncbi:membrane bound O-acyl transferase family-domain-containing protein [Pterulicium gracile]|uniref:Membrane bound O-acyl transferase family-domain-containing protein n=1 Tax=Pterulicium gracile TaxID=1884261 RepID=A0A5C3Q5X4_9AGAR|nr:membrane bound O-acyl transferase family-domain-containing protein [Pterula gracilis]